MSNLPVMTIWPWSIRATAVNSTSPVSALVRRVMVAVRAIVPASFPPRYHTECCVMTSPAERPLRVLSMYEDFVVLLVKCRACGTVARRPSGDRGPEGLVLRLDEELPGERDLAVGELGHAVVEDLAGLLAGAEGDRRDELHGADLRSVPAPHGVLREDVARAE